MDAVSVRYGHTEALRDVTLTLARGEIHTLVGENGAGKSTLLRLLAGAVAPTAGTVTIAPGARIEWIPQEISLAEDLTASEWIFLGRELRRSAVFLWRTEMERQARAALAEVSADIDPNARLAALSGPQRKQVQIARALRARPSLLLVDEPTGVLGTGEARALFDTLRQLRDAGATIAYVSHHLSEILALADRVTVLRDGRVISTDQAGTVSESVLVHRMVGRAIDTSSRSMRREGETILQCEDVATGHLEGFELEVRAGEIVGLAGLVGAGRSEALEAVAGLRGLRRGRVRCRFAPVLMPEDRANKGLISTFTVRENIFTPAVGAWLRRDREMRSTEGWRERLHIRAGGTESAIGSLSGGNQQKVLFARALRRASKLLLLDEPTAGVDVAVKAEIHQVIQELADKGAAVVLASSDLPELLQLSDRIVALRSGRVAGIVVRDQASEETIAALIVGAEERQGAAAEL